MEKQVAIIGAGISGLLACKYTVSKGFNPIVFEARNSIGGVWINTVETTKLQTPKPAFQFSDFPWPDSVSEIFPNQSQVLDYLQSYAHHFDLLKHIKFSTKVLGIKYQGASDEEMQSWSLWGGNGEPFSSRGKWIVEAQDTQNLSAEVYRVDFVILCVGRFSDVPNIPEFPPDMGPEAFHGDVIHAMDYANMDYESARDFSNGVEHPCRVLYRTEHWNIPDYIPWGVPLAYLYLNRFSELMVHKPGEGFLLSLLATILAPLRLAFSKFVESDVKKKLRLAKFGMVPKHSFIQELNSCLIATVPHGFYDKVEEGSIILKKAPSFSFCKEGIKVQGEDTPLETDLVILATGFKGEKKLKDIFESKTFQDCILGSPDAAVPLYRECIHPRIPQLAVIGFSESVANLYTSEMRCRWTAELLDGTFKLPSIKEMEKHSAKWDQYLKRYSGPYYRRSCIGALHIWYNDQLCKDMGWNPKRKKGFFAELFEPYGPADYVSS
ncbi:FLAVIN-CONTAINING MONOOXYGENASE 1-RELATED [Salix koriyanagi]|uniref:Flavin-containing monooxygenase n=1 Tax=Salix koriyanagi TaxID=2511006 RepID=A0A9Q0TSK7_9ROSI|nr:FLAVIN-CONTAINING MONOOXYGENASE 1-RELATED [Salix koriyanagi]